ncbi:hypothetical protein FXV91_07175 [Methanosarcina sp. DH2]|uniref:hypothetical protein n=1 Tax=Methanosarcina sp. DH2 TaxID=2605639 RepID=UPI001E4E39B0|nr:hypothetical protein [Methanosarcina sp. DH2]MCC4769987.1 hypothetical protein [Methanosarcina sp. DH2]
MKLDHGKSAHGEHGAPGDDLSQSMLGGNEGMHGDIESMAEDCTTGYWFQFPLRCSFCLSLC